MQQRRAAMSILFCLLLSLLSCNSELTSTGDSGALSILNESLKEAYLGEAYTATIRAVRGLTPYSFVLSKGSLPPGLELSGGSIVGTPSQEGDFSFTITVSDAKLSKSFADFSLSVRKPPPAELRLNVPLTEVQGTITLRAELKNVRDVQAFRALMTWDAALFEYVEGSVRASRDNLALFSQATEGSLQVDMAVLGASLAADRRMFEFELRPISASFLEIVSKVEFASSQDEHAYFELREGRALERDFTDPADAEPTNPANDPSENTGGDL